MRQESIRISERTFMEELAASLYGAAPNKQPRKIEIIMMKARDAFRNHPMCWNDNEYRTIMLPEREIHEQFKDMLMQIEEMCELNLSQVEFDKGVKWDDPNRTGYRIVTRFDKHDSESWKTDFIDLDATIPNAIGRMIWMTKQAAWRDCNDCKSHRKGCGPCGVGEPIELTECDSCVNNPNHKDNYTPWRLPKGSYTFACKHDCPKAKYICCEECPQQSECMYRCDGDSKVCGNAINHRSEESEEGI